MGALLERLESTRISTKHDDCITSVGSQKVFQLEASAFHDIPVSGDACQIAFVDGGNGTIAESANLAVSLNRLHSCVFRGPKKMPASRSAEFLVLASKTGEKSAYDISLFPRSESDRALLPSEQDATNHILSVPDSNILSSVRRLAEWRMALGALGSLSPGDMLVMDGSLLTLGSVETAYADELYREAGKRGITICALAKTSRLLTRGGEPLINRVRDISKSVEFPMWYVEVADKVSARDEGFVMVARLHPNAAIPFRFEILREQFDAMDHARRSGILASLAANSGDKSFLGYPYGLVDADRWAQVRNRDLYIYRGWLDSRLRASPKLRGMAQEMRDAATHQWLNGVSS